MARIDSIMMDEIGVNTYQLMEMAGYMVARCALGARLSATPSRPGATALTTTTRKRILFLAGTGGNGGDAMVAARFLAGWGHDCTVILTKPSIQYTGIVAHQLAALENLGIPVIEPIELESLPNADLIIDGLLGFSLRGNPRGEAARLIALANDHPAPTLAIDIPSGLNADTGEVGDPCIRAAMTVTLALPKAGLMSASADITGEIVLADPSLRSGGRVSPQLYRQIDIEVPVDLFAAGPIVHL